MLKEMRRSRSPHRSGSAHDLTEGAQITPSNSAARRFQFVLIKPSHYGDDGYVIRWWRAMIPSNSLAAVYGVALDCIERDVLGTNARDRALRQVAAAVGEALVLWFGAAGAQVTEADRLATDPLAFGLVSAMHATVTRWVELGAKVPNRDHLIELAADAAWALVDVRLRAYGLDVDPDAPIEACSRRDRRAGRVRGPGTGR